jgi:hypothetical protein
MSDEDWRLRGQQEYLTGAALVRHKWSPPPPGRAWRLKDGSVMQGRSSEAEPPAGAVEEVTPRQWDHDHCDFCWATLMDTSGFEERWREEHSDVLDSGYTPAPPHEGFGSVWVCPACFEDFRERFGWSVVEAT